MYSTGASFSVESDFLRALSSIKSLIMLTKIMNNRGGRLVGEPPDMDMGLII